MRPTRYTSNSLFALPKSRLLTLGAFVSTSWKMLRRAIHLLAILLMCLALSSASGVAWAGSEATFEAAGQVRSATAVDAQVHDLGAGHEHGDQRPCGHGKCGQCCPSCSNAAIGFGLRVEHRSLIEVVAAVERFFPARTEHLHAWLSQLPFRPPCSQT